MTDGPTGRGEPLSENPEPIGLELAFPPMVPKILIVDDDQNILTLLSAVIRRNGYDCDAVGSLQAARLAMREQTYDIVFLDLMLPDGFGLNLLDTPADSSSHSIVVIITAQQGFHTAVHVIRTGAYDFIPKPFTLAIFSERLSRVVDEWRSRVRYQYYQTHLEHLIRTMTDKLAETSKKIDQTYDMTVSALGAALDLRDPETEEHCRRVSENSVRLGEAIGMSGGQLRNLKWGAYLHDIGKIGIPEHVLLKSTSLTAEEMGLIKGHPLLGYRMISAIGFLKDAAEVVLYHHEHYDGGGYPHGLKGDDIPLTARIFAVIDTMDAMVYDRPYRKALPFTEVVEELKRESGRHFDPSVVKKFLEIPKGIWRAGDRNTGEDPHHCIVDAGGPVYDTRR